MKEYGNGLWLVQLALLCLTMMVGCDSKVSKPSREGDRMERLVFGEFSKGLPHSGRWRQGIAFGDINQDGHMDIIAGPARLPQTDEEKRPSVWYGNGQGVWSASQLTLPSDMEFEYGSLGVGHYNGDEWIDIAFAMHLLGPKAFKGTAEGKYVDFSSGLPQKENFSARAIVSGNFNNDGFSDIACVSESSIGRGSPTMTGVVVCYGSDTGWRCVPIGGTETRGLFGDHLTTGDVNGDGNLDIAVGSLEHTKALIVWINDGKGDFFPFNKGLPEKVHYPAVALADIDGDGRDDLIASITGFGREGIKGLRVFVSRPDRFDEMSNGLPSDSLFFAVDAADLNNDGSVEIIGGTSAGGISVFTFGDGRWEQVPTAVSGLPEAGLGRIYGVYCVDLDGDGRKDIALNASVGNEGKGGGIRVFLNRSGE